MGTLGGGIFDSHNSIHRLICFIYHYAHLASGCFNTYFTRRNYYACIFQHQDKAEVCIKIIMIQHRVEEQKWFWSHDKDGCYAQILTILGVDLLAPSLVRLVDD